METIIRLEGINKIYRTDEVETQALENVNLQVNKGEFLSIMGPSGCGKSTLLNIMGLLDAPTSGSVLIDGTATEKLSDKALAAFRNEKLGFVFQSFFMNSNDTVLNNVILPLKIAGVGFRERRRRAMDALRVVGLAEKAKNKLQTILFIG